MFTIQNIVCTANLGSTLYLPGLTEALGVAEYNPKRFAAVTFRLRWPKTTALFFGSGKIVCAGAKTKNLARLALLYYVDIIRKRLGLAVGVYDFRVQNVVASANAGAPLCLERLCAQKAQYTSYEPELFPGVVYRCPEAPCVMLVFDSGRMVITGGKCEEDIRRSWEHIAPVVAQCHAASAGPGLTVTHKKNLLERVGLSEEDLAPILNDI